MAAMISFFQSRVVKIEQQLFFIAYVVCTFLFRGRILITRKFLLLFVVFVEEEGRIAESKKKKKKRRKIDSLRYNNCRDNNTKNTRAPLLW
jgi:hypothetical protein